MIQIETGNTMNRLLLALLLAALLMLSACAIPGQNAKPGTTAADLKTPTTEQRTDDAMGFSCDAVFFGDSITADSNFGDYYPELRIVNLGVYGDTIEDLRARVDQVRTANPARIFVLVGINCLRPDNVDDCLDQYRALLRELSAACPRAELVIQSVLPIGRELDADGRENDAVRRFNTGLRGLAAEYGLAYADIYAAYEKDGVLDPALTRDGVHLNFTAYGPWAEVIRPLIGG